MYHCVTCENAANGATKIQTTPAVGMTIPVFHYNLGAKKRETIMVKTKRLNARQLQVRHRCVYHEVKSM